jgi:ankyrin repeat protein
MTCHDIEAVQELLSAKADVSLNNNNGVTALMEVSKGYDDVVKLLKEAGAKE